MLEYLTQRLLVGGLKSLQPFDEASVRLVMRLVPLRRGSHGRDQIEKAAATPVRILQQNFGLSHCRLAMCRLSKTAFQTQTVTLRMRRYSSHRLRAGIAVDRRETLTPRLAV